MRVFLALGVFIHHASIWFNYIKTGLWEAPDSNFYNQCGQTSVCLFFMITSFLFVSKMIKSDSTYNWKHFFISRVMRLTPMYYFSLIIIIILTVLFLTHWKINVGMYDFVKSIFHWLLFGIISSGSINNVEYTGIINAGIVWTLRFEWLFYFSMPILGFELLKNRPALHYIILSIIFSGSIMYTISTNQMHHLYAFAIGAIAPFILKYTNLGKNSESVLLTLLIVVSIILVGQFKNIESVVCKLLIGVLFTCVALGNSLLGLLKAAPIKLLGDISYSTYLLHGIVLFYTFYYGIGIEDAKKLSPC